MVRCFVAIECGDPEVVKGIGIVQGVLSGTGVDMKAVEAENIHLTLKFLGEIDEHMVDEVAKVVKGIRFDPFKFKVEQVGTFPNLGRPQTIWAGITDGVTDLSAVFDEVDDKLSKLGFERERRRFQPHLTICRVKTGRNREKLVEELLRVKDYVFGEVSVDRVELKKSVLTQSGPIYTTLAESQHS